MKRFLPFILLASAPAQAPAHTSVELWNDFAATAAEWVKLYNLREPGLINAHELRLWNDLKHKWPEVKRAVDATY